MKKETLLSYVGKGDVNHHGYIINVTKKDFDNILSNFVKIELKPINEYCESALFTGFLDCVSDEDLSKMEDSFEEAYKIMREQELLINKDPIKLTQINNISSNYIASFIDEKNNKYVLIENSNHITADLCTFYGEPEYSIRVPVEINGQVVKPKYSFWLNSAIYNIDDFNKMIDKENYNCENDEEMI